ncbi:MAG: hypothetical protein ACJAS3_000284 [Roseivirga sp.]|jgi:hypothetical protein
MVDTGKLKTAKAAVNTEELTVKTAKVTYGNALEAEKKCSIYL